MNRIKKTLALTTAGIMTMMTIHTGSLTAFAQESSLFRESNFAGILQERLNQEDLTVTDETADEKIAEIFGKPILKSMLSGDTAGKDKAKPKIITFKVKSDGEKEFLSKDVKAKSGYKLTVYKDAVFEKELDKEKDDKDKKIMIPAEAGKTAEVFIKTEEDKDDAKDDEIYYKVIFEREKAKDDDKKEEKLSVLGVEIDLKAADATKENPKVVAIKTKKANLSIEQGSNDFVGKGLGDVAMFSDKSFTKENKKQDLEEGKTISVFLKVRLLDNSEKFYEIQITREAEKKDDKGGGSGGGGSTGGGSHRSPVRPDGSSGGSKDDKKDDKKDNKQDDKKKEEIKDNKVPKAQQPLTPNVSNKISTKLTIGKKAYTVMANGTPSQKTMDVAPMVHQGRTVLPARVISELLGVEVKYDQKTKTATFIYQGTGKVQLTLGQKMMTVNGQKVALSGEVISKDGRVLLPLRDIQKAFSGIGLQASLTWDAATKTVSIEK